jgi:hypothetical protein
MPLLLLFYCAGLMFEESSRENSARALRPPFVRSGPGCHPKVCACVSTSPSSARPPPDAPVHSPAHPTTHPLPQPQRPTPNPRVRTDGLGSGSGSGSGVASTLSPGGPMGAAVWSSTLPFMFTGSSPGTPGRTVAPSGLSTWGSPDSPSVGGGGDEWGHGSGSSDALNTAKASLVFARSITDAEASLLAMQWPDVLGEDDAGVYSAVNPLGINPVYQAEVAAAPPSALEIRIDNIVVSHLVREAAVVSRFCVGGCGG